MKLHVSVLVSLSAIAVACDAFASLARLTKTTETAAMKKSAAVEKDQRTLFLDTLDQTFDLNLQSEDRTQLLNDVINSKGGLPNPGSDFASVAPGVWKVCYAPHMTIMAGLFQGDFSVQYDLKDDGTMTSHARYKFPLFGLFGFLSVSGTYGSVSNDVCRVDFDEAWMRSFDDDSFEQGPYPNVESVPDSITKSLIRNIGKALFIEPFAVFPVSYLDEELIVFDFELLGTRICARKES